MEKTTELKAMYKFLTSETESQTVNKMKFEEQSRTQPKLFHFRFFQLLCDQVTRENDVTKTWKFPV